MDLRRWCKKNRLDVRLNYDFGSTHGYCCKAKVKYFIKVSSLDILSELLLFIKKTKVPYIAVGGGSNILFKSNYNGAVISFANDKIEFVEKSCSKDDVCIKVGASVTKKSLVEFCVQNKLSGVEFWSGIPGCVGGGAAMNAGAYGKDISCCIYKMELALPGSVELVNKENLKWHYRGVELPDNSIITSVYLKLKRSEALVEADTYKYANDRKQKHPLNFPSCGSVFKNPSCTSGDEGLKSWELIQKSGLAGFSIGGARISLIHTNFIINQGCAESSDILKLIEEVQNRVKNNFSVKLEPEVRII